MSLPTQPHLIECDLQGEHTPVLASPLHLAHRNGHGRLRRTIGHTLSGTGGQWRIRGNQQPYIVSDHVDRRVAKHHLNRRVHRLHQKAFPVQRQHTIGHGVQNGLDQNCAVVGFLLHRILLRHVAKHQHRTNNLAVVRQNGRTAVRNVIFTTVAGQQHGMVRQFLNRAVLQSIHHRIENQFPAALVHDLQDIFNSATTGLLLRPPRERCSQRIQAGDLRQRIGGNHAVPDGVQGHRQLLLTALQGPVGILKLLVQ